MLNYIKLARLNQPIGIFLLFLPCLFGIALASKMQINLENNFSEIVYFSLLFFIGSIVMRSAGCVVNDILDYKFDRQVKRTKSRPLAQGDLSFNQAIVFLTILLLIGLLILVQFNVKTIFSGFFALILLITYPLMKRFTYYPQLFLGLTFNFGIIMASFAVFDEVRFEFFILYFSAIIWTVIYDTVYAFQDIEDDLKIGVKSSAIKFSKNPKKILSILNFIMFISLIYLGWHVKFGSGFFLAILSASFLLDGKIVKCDLKNSGECLSFFKVNFFVGLLILLAIILG